jgi:hypothetical protein
MSRKYWRAACSHGHVRGRLAIPRKPDKDNQNENHFIRNSSHGGVVYGIIRSRFYRSIDGRDLR